MKRLLLLPLLLLGCSEDPYEFVASAYDGSVVDGYALGDFVSGECMRVESGLELCDGKDNDCDGQIDEGFDLQKDPKNCGKCGSSCLLPGALTACELGKCVYKYCAPDFYDLNNDASDGCEYECTKTGSEICDGADNDCNGEVDETFDLQKDVDNCGKCDNICQLANATPKCEGGVCKIQSCDAGYIDKDKQDSTGCESPCTITASGQEICDGIDNDCNGVVDDPNGTPINFASDPMNCGGCGIQCLVPNATATCVNSQCVFSACDTGFFDADKDPSNGCECVPAGSELCDGKDNDCNGQIDDNITTGTCGTNVGECTAGTVTCQNGVEVCTGEVGPKQELCDGLDNDCDNQLDPPACVFAATGREVRLDNPNYPVLGLINSAQLAVAGVGDRILAAWLDRRSNRGDVYGNISTDGGKTWLSTADIMIAAETNDKLEPQVAFGGPSASSVRAYVAYERYEGTAGRSVYLRSSTNGGQTWGAQVLVKKTGGGDALFTRLKVVPGASASAADTVVVCWERIETSGPVNPDIYCNRSTNSGATFGNADSQVNTVANSAIVPDLAVDSSYAYVTWQQGGNIYVSRAPLSGNFSFSSPALLSGGAGQDPRILADGANRVVVVWEDLRGSLIDIRANTSLNSGGSWLADGVRVDNDVVNGDSTQPVLAARPGGRILAAWADTSRGKHDVYVNYSDNGGATWSGVSRRVDATTAGTYTSKRPHLAVDPANNNVYVAWEDYRNGAYRDIYFSVSLDNGMTWNVPDYRINEATPAGVADARAPVIWAAPSRVAVLWMDNRVLKSGALATGPNADVYCSYVE